MSLIANAHCTASAFSLYYNKPACVDLQAGGVKARLEHRARLGFLVLLGSKDRKDKLAFQDRLVQTD